MRASGSSSPAFRLEGHEVAAAEDGETALQRLAAEAGGFDLLLSDIRMPALSGIALTHAAAARWPDLRSPPSHRDFSPKSLNLFDVGF